MPHLSLETLKANIYKDVHGYEKVRRSPQYNYEPAGRGFDSLRARQFFKVQIQAVKRGVAGS
ncbi:hypothetical protein NBG4_120050 [Candidatus Sulfobium mesophilum]|uniref:Uncharacterized protein n=1 Tax=Candidatus Sulfobium mesophilum TaxID=2016548 RepID=A0A2U3QEK6_9BACT|nr:hypothetical protein NBG4_120050 [Candidatus Sulfobium mesophilum]